MPGTAAVSASLTPQERRLRLALIGLALVSAAFTVDYVVLGISGASEFPFVVNSIAKDALFVLLAAVAIADIRRHSWLVVALIVAHLALVAGLGLSLAVGNVHDISATLSATPLPPETIVWIWLGADLGIAAGLTWLYHSARKARWELRYLGATEFVTLMALSEVLVLADNDVLTPEQVARNVDDYLAGFRAEGKWQVRLALFALAVYPLLTLRPPLAMMSPAVRKRFVERRFLEGVWQRGVPGPLRSLTQSMIRGAQQLTFLGFYGDERGAATAGYVRFSARPEYAAAMERVDRDRPRVECLTPGEVDGDAISADVLIVGSGAAGATLAYELAARDREVLVVERGRHVDPSQFTEHEPTQLSNLFADGALTYSRDFRFQVAQGMCVGGSTVVNNAVCFDLPDRVLNRWNDPDGLWAGLDAGRLATCFAEVRAWLPVVPQSAIGNGDGRGILNPSWPLIQRGVHALGLDRPPYDFQVVDCNIADCLGCGYCNIGCAYGKKLSMLDNTLPRAQREFGTEAVRVLSECFVERLEADERHATGALCRLSDGRALRIRAKTIVVSGGAIASSVLLSRSGLGGELAGRNLGFNIAAPMTGDFDEEIHAERGLQISHCLLPPSGEGFALETWFNPAGAQALFMPGWFDVHRENMKRYPHMACLGAVTGSRRNATVRPVRRGRGVKLDYMPDPEDFARVVAGVELAGRVMLAAGARRVMPPSFRYLEFASARELSRLAGLVADDSDLMISSAHPQGGNPISADRGRGVVDPHFRVYGFDNLFVCDASVFPSPITVNPQLTVMALARYAADHIEPDRQPTRLARPAGIAQAGGVTVQLGVPGSG